MNKPYNPTADLFGGLEFAQQLDAFEWAEHSVRRKYLVIFTGRSGSTWLAKMIARTGLLPEPDEFFNPDFIKHQLSSLGSTPRLTSYLSHLTSRFSKAGAFGAEIDALRLQWLEALIDFSSSVFDPIDTPYVWLTRDDIISQAFSFAAAKASGKWHKVNNTFIGQGGSGLPVTHADILKDIREIVRQEEYATRFFANYEIEPFRITYEEMIADTALALSRTMRHIGVAPMADALALALQGDTTQRLQYDERTEILLDFEESHKPLVSYIRSNRRSLNVKSVEEVIRASA